MLPDRHAGQMVDASVEAATTHNAPVLVTCPGLGCRAPAWRMPNGDVYCTEIGGVIPPEQPPAPADPMRAPLCPDCKEFCLVEGQQPCTEDGCGCSCRGEQ